MNHYLDNPEILQTSIDRRYRAGSAIREERNRNRRIARKGYAPADSGQLLTPESRNTARNYMQFLLLAFPYRALRNQGTVELTDI